MDYQQIALGFHLLGFALGLGGATISDISFLSILKRRVLSVDDYNFLHLLSKVIWLGLVLLIASGLVIFWLIYAERGSVPMLASPKWQTKLTLVGVVLLNGFFFKFSIFPKLKNLIGPALSLANMGPIVGRLALSGTVSIVSWYCIFIVTLLPRTYRPHFLYFVGTYLVIVFVGFVLSKSVIKKVLR